MGFTPENPERLKSGVQYVLSEAVGRMGHMYLPADELMKNAGEILGVDAQLVEHTVRSLLVDKNAKAISVADAKGEGFQTIQSLLAIGSGGILGRGIGQSRQKYLWVPEPHNDFIFSIVCEELGLVGAVLIIILFALLVWRGFTIAMRAPDKFGSMLAIGLTFQVGLQAMLNIWVVTNTIPNTGISLPFFSYGGTSLLILLAEMGIVLSVSRGADIEKIK